MGNILQKGTDCGLLQLMGTKLYNSDSQDRFPFVPPTTEAFLWCGPLSKVFQSVPKPLSLPEDTFTSSRQGDRVTVFILDPTTACILEPSIHFLGTTLTLE